MGKKQHQKDKMYLTSTEWSTLYGGKRSGTFLDQFTQLGDFSGKIRMRAALEIVESIKGKGQQDDSMEKISDLKEYTLKRLVRGLASSNKLARVGFSDALTLVLRHVDSVSTDQVLEKMEEYLPLKTKEDRVQHMIGRIMVWGTIIRSHQFGNCINTCLPELLDYSKKPFLESIVCSLLNELIQQATAKELSKQVWPLLKKYIDGNCAEPSCCVVYLVLAMHNKDPSLVEEEFNTICTLDTYAKILQQSTSQLPRIHPVVDLILKTAENSNKFNEFWEQVVGKLSRNPSAEKHFLSVHLIQTVFREKSDLSFLMNEVYIEQLMYPLVKTGSPMHGKARELLNELESFDESKSLNILKFVTSHSNGYRFDSMTKSTLVHNTLQKSSCETIEWYAKYLKKKLTELMKEDSSEKHLKFDTIILEQLANLTHLPIMHSNHEFKSEMCAFVATKYFSGDPAIAKKPNTNSLLKCVAPTPKALSQAAENIASVLKIYVDMKEKNPALKFSKKVESATKVLKKLKKSEKQAETVLSLRLLVGYLTLSYIINVLDDVTVLDDVLSSATAFLRGKSAEDEVEWIDLTMEALVAALAIQNTHFKNMVLNAFKMIHKDITDDSLTILLEVFRGDENEQDLRELEADSDEDEDEDDASEDEETPSDEGGDSNNENASEVDFGDDALRNQLQKVLGYEGDSDNEQEATDEDMFKLDGAIAAAFSSRFKSQTSANNKEKKRKEIEALHYEMRCLQILTSYVNSSDVKISHVLTIAKSLLMFATSKKVKTTHRPIISHVAETLRQISVLKVSSLTNDATAEQLKDLGDFIFDKIKVCGDGELKISLGQILPFVVKCLKLAEDNDEWTRDTYRHLLHCYLTEATTTVAPPLFVRFCEIFPDYSLMIVKDLEASFGDWIDKREKRVQILGLLVAALKLCPPKTDDKKALKKTLHNISAKVVDCMEKSAETLTANTYVEFLDLLKTVAKKCQDAGLDNILEKYNDQIHKMFDNLKKKNLPNQVKRRLNQAIKQLFPGENFTVEKQKKMKKKEKVLENGNEKGEEENGVGEEDSDEEIEEVNGEEEESDSDEDEDMDEDEEEEDEESSEEEEEEESVRKSKKSKESKRPSEPAEVSEGPKKKKAKHNGDC